MKSSVWRVKTIVRISFLVAALTLIRVYFWGLGQHRTFFENSMISITILSVVFFLFISIGLYRGINVVHETHDEKVSPTSSLNSIHTTSDLATSFDAPDIHIDGDDLGSILVSILLWIGWAILVVVAVWFFSEVILGSNQFICRYAVLDFLSSSTAYIQKLQPMPRQYLGERKEWCRLHRTVQFLDLRILFLFGIPTSLNVYMVVNDLPVKLRQ
ncbi:MAG: hypothetical protein HYZ44_14140 [Bacteroidetes bacterium]|nr:hypothetical protein [Bacteroidota bacterium]